MIRGHFLRATAFRNGNGHHFSMDIETNNRTLLMTGSFACVAALWQFSNSQRNPRNCESERVAPF
jgi:hypothetical protein